jgi:multidrug efflux pump subunit AcrA (membrane-fusion protein)
VEQSGIVQIVALQSGIVNQINVREGDEVRGGQSLLNLANNFLGANIAAVQSRRATLAYEANRENFETSMEIIEARREQVGLQRDNDEAIRDIRRQSRDDTSDVLRLFDNQLRAIRDGINDLENINVLTVQQEQELTGLRSAQSTIQAQTVSLRATIRSTDYELDRDGAAWQLGQSTYELTLRQLEIEERSLELGRQMSALDLQIANINASLMRPTSPFAGRIEHINVRVGDLVGPGQVLMTIAAPNRTSRLAARVDERLISSIDASRSALISINDVLMPLDISHLSSVPTVGATYNVTFDLDALSSSQVTNGAHLEIRLPLIDSYNHRILLPIDIVYQTTTQDYVLVAELNDDGNYIATLQEITLGRIIGSMVEVPFGLTTDSLVIVDRGVMAGEQIILRE